MNPFIKPSCRLQPVAASSTTPPASKTVTQIAKLGHTWFTRKTIYFHANLSFHKCFSNSNTSSSIMNQNKIIIRIK